MKLRAEFDLSNLTAAEFAAFEAKCAEQGVKPEARLSDLIRKSNTGKLPAHPAIAKAKRAASKPTAGTKGARRVA